MCYVGVKYFEFASWGYGVLVTLSSCIGELLISLASLNQLRRMKQITSLRFFFLQISHFSLNSHLLCLQE